ncbi:hypothetical protein IPCEC31_34890 [Escherichia coli]|nr:hypothetical protein IPCEC31_34890 [Escherichia coli]
MNNFLTFHTEATPDGVNIMYRSNDGMTERVEAVSYIDAVNRLDAGDYDDKPDEGMSIHLAIADGGNQTCARSGKPFSRAICGSECVWIWLFTPQQ